MSDPHYDCFISYAKEDHRLAQKLFVNLKRSGVHAWMDKPPRPYHLDGLKPGETWDSRLRQVISESTYFIPLFSSVSVAKSGYVQSEFRQALNRLSQIPHGQIYVVPVRLDNCRAPSMRVDGISFDQYQWIDCFGGDFAELVEFLASKAASDLGDKTVAGPHISTSPKTSVEFYGEISSNRTLCLSGEYILTEVPIGVRRELQVDEAFDGHQISIVDVENLSLVGDPSKVTSLIVSPQYVNVLEFRKCRSITIKNLTIGHSPKTGTCMGGVVKLVDCFDFDFVDCNLFGCGTYAFVLENSDRISFAGCSMRDCTYGIATLENSRDVTLNSCIVHDNTGYDGFHLVKSIILIDNSTISKNDARDRYDKGGTLFNCTESSVSIRRTGIFNNSYSALGDVSESEIFEVKFRGNTWQDS